MGEIISSFLSNASTYLVYAAIVILFIVACIKCLAPVTGNTRALNRAIKAIKKDKPINRDLLETLRRLSI